MFETYFPVFVMVAVSLVVALGLFTVTSLAGPKNPSAAKNIPYESGSETVGGQHVKPSVKFYLTAILFVVFDIEAVFLFPWGSLFRQLGWFGLMEMVLFLTVLTLTLVYAWRKGALEWEL